MKAHLKRSVIPKQWKIKRKKTRFSIRPLPRGKFKLGVPLVIVFRDLLKKAKSSKEVKSILLNNEINVDGVRRKEIKFLAGLMDSLAIPSIKEYFRVLLNKNNQIELLPISKEEASLKLCKIVGKNFVKGKQQINLHDGRSLLDEGKYKTGDSLLLGIPKQEIKEHIKLEKGCRVYLIGGKRAGSFGKVEDIKDNKIYCKIDKIIFDIDKKNIFVVGKEKGVIKLEW